MKNIYIIIIITIIVITTGMNETPAEAKGLQDQVDQAVTILERFQNIPEKSIPPAVLKNARGLAIITVLKGGFIVSGRVGRGIVIARTKDGWSGPSAIGTGGIGFGLQIGGQVSEFVIVLNTDEAVKAFSHKNNVAVGTDLSAAAGPIGRSIGADVTPLAAIYTYSRSQGLFAGISLEGTVITTRAKENTNYYGKKVLPEEILSGKIKPPSGAEKLIQILSKY